MAHEIEYQTATMPGAYRLPRRFESFDEAWETAKKLIDVYNLSSEEMLELRFIQVE